jgi:hypothetical protein
MWVPTKLVLLRLKISDYCILELVLLGSHFVHHLVFLLSAYQEKIPARNEIYAHAQDFAVGDVLLQAILKAFIPQPLNKQQTKVFQAFF